MNRAVVGGHHPGLPVLVPVTFSTRQTYPVGDLSLSRKWVRAARAILQRGTSGVVSEGMNDEHA